MCGICGYYSIDGNIDKNLLALMTDELKHRGPDECGYYTDEKIALGHRRLSIIDLCTGQQPMTNEDKNIWIIYNGEFYNFKEYIPYLQTKGHNIKTASDTEIIIHLYEEFGVDCLQKIRGMFAFALWDKNKDMIFLARDRMGQKPIFYTLQNNKFYFASELKSILKDKNIKRTISNQSIDYYLTYQYIPSPFSVYENIYKLMPAEYLLFKNNRIIKKERYWELPVTENSKITYNDAKEKLRELLFDSVQLRLISDVPIGVFLSGGIDSSIITAIMSKISNTKIKTFSIGFEEADYNELDYARTVAKKYDTEHTEFIVKPNAIELLEKIAYYYNEPYADSSALPTYYVSKMTSKYVKVALNGDAGDELFCGYHRYVAIKILSLLNKFPFIKPLIKSVINTIPENGFNNRRLIQIRNFLKNIDLSETAAYKKLISHFDDERRKKLYTDNFKNEISFAANDDYIVSILNKFSNVNSITQKIMFLDQLTYLPEDLLVKVDIATMMNSIEGRSPMLDHKFVEFVNSLPVEFKLNMFRKKYIFKDTFKDLLPEKILKRNKMGFGVPLFHWFRNELKDFAYTNILNGHFIHQGYFNKDYVKKLIDNHINKSENNSLRIWNLLILEMWYKVYNT